jgi:hypothetical protein
MALDLLPLPVFLSWKCRTAQLAGAKAWSTAPHAVVTTMPQLYCIVNVALVGSNLCTGAPGVCLAAVMLHGKCAYRIAPEGRIYLG